MPLSVTTGYSGAGLFTHWAVNAPATLVPGDLRVVTITVSDGAGWSPPAGWTDGLNHVDGRGNRLRISWRIYQAGDPTQDTWSFTANSWFTSFGELDIRGLDLSQPFEITPVASDGMGTDVVAPSVSPPLGDGLLITSHGIRVESGVTSTTITRPSVMTHRIAVRPTSGTTGHVLGVYTQQLTSAGATGTRTAVVSQSGEWLSQSLVVKQGPYATLPVETALSADLRKVTSGQATLPVEVALEGTATADVAGAATLPVATAVSVTGVLAAATADVQTAITAAGARAVGGAVVLDVGTGLAVDATVTPGAASANLPVTTGLTADAAVTAEAATTLAVDTTVTADPIVVTEGAVVLAAEVTVLADAFLEAPVAAVATAGTALVVAEPTRTTFATATLSVATALGATATAVPAGGAILTVATNLTAGPIRVAAAAATLTVQATLVAGEPQPQFEPPPPYEKGDIGPVVGPRVVVRHWELLVAETRTGTVIAELPFTDLGWDTPINDIGRLTATIPIQQHVQWLGPLDDRSPINRLRAVLSGEWKYSLCAVFDGQPIIAGPIITSTPVTGEARVTVGAAELGALLKRRKVRTPGVADPTLAAANLNLGPTSLPNLMRTLIETAISPANGPGFDLPLILPTVGTVGEHVRNYLGSELGDYWERIEQLTDVIDGPDVRFEPELTDEPTRRALSWRVRIGEPYLGTWVDGENPPRPPWVWDQGAGLRGLTTDRDASKMVMRPFVPGQARTEPAATTSSTDTTAPQDAPKPIGRAENLELIAAGYPILEGSYSDHASTTEQATLDAHAAGYAVADARPVEVWNATVDAATWPRLGMWRVGDTAAFNVRGELLIDDGEHIRRVIGASGNGGTDVQLVLAPVPAVV